MNSSNFYNHNRRDYMFSEFYKLKSEAYNVKCDSEQLLCKTYELISNIKAIEGFESYSPMVFHKSLFALNENISLLDMYISKINTIYNAISIEMDNLCSIEEIINDLQ